MSIRISNERLFEIICAYQQHKEESNSEKMAYAATCMEFRIKPETLRRYIGLAAGDNLKPQPTDDEIREQLDKKLDIGELQQQLRHWKKQAESYRNELRDQEGFITAITALMPKLPLIAPPRLSKKDGKYGDMTACAQVSDFHAGRRVSLLETEGMAEYNFDIFCARLWMYVRKIVEVADVQRSGHAIRRLWLPILGDMMNDEHRDENLRGNEWPMSRGVFKTASVMVQAIRFLLRSFETIEIDGVPGNEPRLTKEKTAKYQYNNWDWILYRIIQVALAPEIRAGRVKFFVPFSPEVVVEQTGFSYLLAHGDKAKSWNGIPYYGIARYVMKQHDHRRANRIFNPNGKDFYFTFLADKHNYSSLDHNRTFINGAGCGTDEYARNVLTVTGPAMQRLMFLTDKFGPTYDCPIYLNEAQDHPFVVTDDDDVVGEMENIPS